MNRKLILIFSFFLFSFIACSHKISLYQKYGVDKIGDSLIISENKLPLDLQFLIETFYPLGVRKFTFENKQFTIAKTVIISNKKNIILEGSEKTKIIFIGKGPLFEIHGSNNIHFRNLFLHSTNTNNLAGQFCFETSKQNPTENIKIEHCVFSERNSSSGFNNILYVFPHSDFVNFNNNTINCLLGSDSGNGYGVLSVNAKKGKYKYNTIYGRTDHGRHAFYLSAGASENIVENNIIYNIPVSAISLAAKSDQMPTMKNTIKSNIILGGATKFTNIGLITLFGNVHENIVSDNSLSSSNSYGIMLNATFGNGKERASKNILRGNSFKNIARAGIFVGGVKDTKIICNEFSSFSERDSLVYPAISVTMDINGNYGSDNITIEKNKTFYNKYGKNSVDVTSSKKHSSNITIRNNKFETLSKGKISLPKGYKVLKERSEKKD